MPRTEHVEHHRDLPAALERLGLGAPRRVIVIVGGAAGLDAGAASAVTALVEDVVGPLCAELAATVVDGGTDSGVMRIVGRARTRTGATFPLVGVTASGTIAGPDALVADPAPIEPSHTGIVVVPGSAWGDESSWIPPVALALAGGRPVAAVLFGGGGISRHDTGNLIGAGIPVIAAGGSGGLADSISAPDRGEDPEVEAFLASPLVIPVDAVRDPSALVVALREILDPG